MNLHITHTSKSNMLLLALLLIGAPRSNAPADTARARLLSRVHIDSTAPRSDSVFSRQWAREPGAGVGIDMNSLANEVSAGLQLSVPFCQTFAVVARPMLVGGATPHDLDLGGRVELQLRSPVYANLLRVYLGVGPQGFYELRGDEAHQKDFSGGWDAGVEVFLNRRFAVHWETGTSGGGVTAGAGPAFSVGFRTYLGG